ncbi:MAG: RsmF rRNA methyltransferase first C-terminal domain-containing protein [Clostridiales bacterium]|nr:RsmF rRNA methyltransferase first C-terminal domain-containing protein [Clostridiales bacterium]
MQLPESFINEMNDFFSRYKYVPREGFYESFDKEPLKGIRFSRSKISSGEQEKALLSDMNEDITPVSWCSGGYYVNNEPGGKDPLYHAGVYYPQEPSAMLPAQVMAAKPGEIVLDLCAAPGGKACRLGEDMRGQGILVANEISFERSKALLRNIERSGIKGCVILNETPENIASRLHLFFDKILIDAPCSGEGMFRRDPGAPKSYMNYGPKVCVPLQESILEAADKCLKEGGSIVYSTCTFCVDEDENQIKRFIERHPEYHVKAHLEISGITHNGEDSILPGSMRIWPHLSEGDGHFCVHIVKGAEKNLKSADDYLIKSEVKIKDKNVEACMAMLDEVLSDKGREDLLNGEFISHGTGVFQMTFDEKLFKGLKVVKTGLYVGDIKPLKSGKKVFEPSNSIALALDRTEVRDDSYLGLSRDDDRLLKYLRGETISVTPEDGLKPSGTILIGIGDFPLGFAKINGQTAKNMYPKAWRLI